MTRRFVPGKGVSHLTGIPLGGRIARHTDAHQSPSGVAKNDQAIEQLERDRLHHEKINRSNASSVIAQRVSSPALRGPDALPYTWPRLIRRLRCRASAIRRVSAALLAAGSPCSSVACNRGSRGRFWRPRVCGELLILGKSVIRHIQEPAEKERDRASRRPIPRRTERYLLLASSLLCPCCRSIPFSETLSAPPIASLDEARRQVGRAALAAYELLSLRLALGLVPGQSPMLGFGRLGLLTTCQFRAFHFPGLLQP
jgi:hypothetical protein